jgi:hypothetical protein
MDALYGEHLDRVRAAVLRSHSLSTVAEWICENTSLRGEPFTFLDHEFQEVIARDPSRQKNVRKCAQVGISELSGRLALAFANVMDSVTGIYTLPTADFAKNFVKTRVDPIILASKALKDALNNTADNTQVKQFGTSFIYFKGTIGQAAAISVPADFIVHDEVDFSDQMVMSTYESRLIHSPHKLKLKFSTPTVDGYGISAEFQSSRRFWNFVKCSHCATWFLPSYFDHVHVPGFDADKKEITKDKLAQIRWSEAKVLCPHCGLEPELTPGHRAWVCENPFENHEAAGYQVQPFDAPRVISAAYLVEASTKYDRWVDFVNFGLGLPAEDKESSFSREELEQLFTRAAMGGFYQRVGGIDMGMMCHVVIAGVNSQGQMLIIHTERVPLAKIKVRKEELWRAHGVALSVMDSQPYTETLFSMQERDRNLFGAVYVTSKGLQLYTLKKTEEEREATAEDKEAKKGEEAERQVNINRNKAFDGFMHFLRAGNLFILEDANKELIIQHMQDMKRVKEFTAEKEVTFVWQKSAKGNDHFHHALLYAWIAAKMRGVAGGLIVLPWLVAKIRTKEKEEEERPGVILGSKLVLPR